MFNFDNYEKFCSYYELSPNSLQSLDYFHKVCNLIDYFTLWSDYEKEVD